MAPRGERADVDFSSVKKKNGVNSNFGGLQIVENLLTERFTFLRSAQCTVCSFVSCW